MRLFAMPRRTPFLGSLLLPKSSFNAAASDSTSRSSPPTTTPSASGRRATWRSCGDGPAETRAAATCEAPILSPTSAPFDPPRRSDFLVFSCGFFGARASFGVRAPLGLPSFSSRFQIGGFCSVASVASCGALDCLTFLTFFAFGSLGCFGCFGSFGSLPARFRVSSCFQNGFLIVGAAAGAAAETSAGAASGTGTVAGAATGGTLRGGSGIETGGAAMAGISAGMSFGSKFSVSQP